MNEPGANEKVPSYPRTSPFLLALRMLVEAGSDSTVDSGEAKQSKSAVAAAPNSSAPVDQNRFRSSVEYRQVRVLAQGGLGRVWLALDPAMNREVAIKELRPDRAGEVALQSRFVREARIHARLQHPNISPFFHFGQDRDGQPFIVMYLIAGQTLEERVKALGAPDWKTNRRELRLLINIFLRACDAIAFAHSRGIIHRDLKPANVMTGEFGEVFVLDWGLAKELGPVDESLAFSPSSAENSSATFEDDSDVTKAGSVLGSLPYMAPEQAGARLKEIGRSADIFGLGGILYYILTCEPPHPLTSTNLHQCIHEIESKPPVPPRDRNSTIPPPLAAICSKATAMISADRYSTVTELAADVRRWLDGEPVKAFQEPRKLRLARWALKHKVGMSALALTLFTAVLIVVITQLHRWASSESLIGQQFLDIRREVDSAAVDLRHDTQRTSNLLTFTASLPSVRGLFQDDLARMDKDAAVAQAAQVLESFVQQQPPVLRAAIVNRAGKALAYYRSAERGGRLLDEDGPVMWAASDIMKSAGELQAGQVVLWPPSKSASFSAANCPTVIAAVPIRRDAVADILGALIIETHFGVMGLYHPQAKELTHDGGPEDWFFFSGNGRLLYYSINSGATLPESSGVLSLAQLFPELASILRVELDELPTNLEVLRGQPPSTIVARRIALKDVYPTGSPVIVVSRPVTSIAGLSSERIGYLASAALMIVTLSIALAVIIAWALVKIVSSV